MKQTIFPKEIIRFSLESHYSRFSKQSKIIYLLVIAMVLGCLAALPLVNVDITVQSRGLIRSRTEPTSIQSITLRIKWILLQQFSKDPQGFKNLEGL